MIVQENITVGQKEFVHTYSDCGRYVVRDGIPYEDAYDLAILHRTYVEGGLIEDGEE